jgi:hypothetical protein
MATRVRTGGSATTERRFYGVMGVVILLLVVAGFAPSYFLRGWIDAGRPLPEISPLIHLHAAVFSAWIGLFIVQTALISGRRHALHRRLGGVMIGLAAAMVVVGVLVAVAQVGRGSGPPDIPPLAWIAVPLFDLTTFAGLVGAGYVFRRYPQTHKRLMLLATILMLQPAIGRMPWPPALDGELGTLMAFLMVLPLIAWDFVQRGRPHRATMIGVAVLAAEQLLRIALWRTEEWQAVAGWIVVALG